MLPTCLLFWVEASDDTGHSPNITSHTPIDSVRHLIKAGVAFDGKVWQAMQLFHNVKFDGFLHYHWSAERVTSAALQ